MSTKNICMTAAFDSGASASKAVYEIRDGSDRDVRFFSQRPSCRPITEGYLTQAWKYIDDNTSLISYHGSHWLVGVNAGRAVEQTYPSIKKAPTTIAKAVAFIGNIARMYPDRAIELTLSLMLPLCEFADADSISDELHKALYDFRINGESTCVLLRESITVVPECSGMALSIPVSPSVLIGFGHRDVTQAYVLDGTISIENSKTLSGYGMIRLLRFLPKSFPHEYQTALYIFNYLATGNTRHLKVLSQEVDSFAASIHQAKQQMLEEVAGQLCDVPNLATDYALCGGNSIIFDEIEAYFPGIKRLRPKKVVSEMRQLFPELKRSPMIYRGLDVFCLWKSLVKEVTCA